MPVYDYQCVECSYRFEVIEPWDDDMPRVCLKCGEVAQRIISASGCFTGNNDAAWVRSVTEVVAKGADSDAHDRRFLKSGKTKADLKAWMKAKGLRHLEPGEPLKPRKPDMSDAAEKIMRMRRDRGRIEIHTR
jgi:putative FmdB family regulatory protein